MKTLLRISSEILQFTLLIRHTLFRIINLIDDSLQYKCFKAKRGTSKHFYPILILIHTSFIITVQEMRQKTDQSRVPCSFVSHRCKLCNLTLVIARGPFQVAHIDHPGALPMVSNGTGTGPFLVCRLTATGGSHACLQQLSDTFMGVAKLG